MVPPPDAADLANSPLYDVSRCWARRCRDDARHDRQIGTEPVRFCDGHAEVFDYQVSVDLQRLQDAAAAPLPFQRKESA